MCGGQGIKETCVSAAFLDGAKEFLAAICGECYRAGARWRLGDTGRTSARGGVGEADSGRAY
jgi:hypothetical protein